MATITTDTFLDGGTARTAGEAWNISNNANLVIRTDTRWHANAPASMTGSIGNINITTAGGVIVDGTKVRWMPFDTGSGTVPAIGTSITQGSVSGYLLGVWANLTSAPTAVGAAMPATGFLKFREVTGGTFSTGALTGISASSTSADVTGWIEVVFDGGVTLGGAINGSGYAWTGEWFNLGTTSGARGQTFQIPTNGGGAATWAYGLQIETSPGSGVFEWYPGINTSAWTTANIASDLRAKYVESVAGGILRIGADASATAIGHLPPAGCAVLHPNIIARQCSTGARAVNIIPPASISSRPTFNTSGIMNFSKVSCDYRMMVTVPPKAFTIADCVWESYFQPNGCKSFAFSNTAVAAVQSPSGNAVSFTNCQNGTITNFKAIRIGIGSHFTLTYCSNLVFTSTHWSAGTGTTLNSANIVGAVDCVFTNVKTNNGGLTFTNCTNVTVDGHDYIERLFGNTNTSGNNRPLTFGNCANLVYQNLTFGENGSLNNCHPYSYVFSSTGGNNKVRVRNAGTMTSPLSCGSNSTLFPQHITYANSSNTDIDVKYQRLFFSGCRFNINSASTGVGNSKNFLYEHISNSYAFTPIGGQQADTVMRGVWGSAPTGQQATEGSNFFDCFSSDTIGHVCFNASTPTAYSSAFYTASLASNPIAGYQSATTIGLPTNGDFVIFETPYWVKGHSSFRNVAPTSTTAGAGNISLQYQLDTGSGWGGTWKALTGANLSAESISVTGFKMKLRVNATATSSSNTFTFARIDTNSSISDRNSNLYPLDTSTLSFTGLVAGSEVRCYTGSDPATAVEIGGTESSGTSFSFTHNAGGSVGFIRIFALGYQPVNYDPYTYSSTDTTLLVQQTVDRNYVNP